MMSRMSGEAYSRDMRYSWWGYIKAIVQAYPDRQSKELSGVATRDQMAVQKAIEDTRRMESGEARMKVIRLVHFDRTHQLPGAALLVPCSERTANRWQRSFFEQVARNRDLLD